MMRQEQLIPGENLLLLSDNGLITLTTHRIRYHHQIWGEANFVSIMLEKISAIQIIYASYPWLGGGGILLTVLGVMLLFGGNGGNFTLLFIIGLLMIGAYFVTQKHVCVITSDGNGKLMFRAKGMRMDALMEMADKVELTKHNRVMELKRVARIEHSC